MTLQQLIGELQTLAIAYPTDTPITVHFHEYRADIVGVAVISDESSVAVSLETQA